MELLGFLGADLAAAADQVDGGLDTRHARQALGAAGARDDAEIHFREAELGARAGDAVMAAERDFQPAAERYAMDGGEDRLVAGFARRDNLGQERLQRRAA